MAEPATCWRCANYLAGHNDGIDWRGEIVAATEQLECVLSYKRGVIMLYESPIPAAQYVKMSTDDQEFSIQNQESAIALYAKQHGFEIVQTYEDAGKSGVVLRQRPGLLQLLNDRLHSEPGSW